MLLMRYLFIQGVLYYINWTYILSFSITHQVIFIHSRHPVPYLVTYSTQNYVEFAKKLKIRNQ